MRARQFRPEDCDAVVALWHLAKKIAYPYIAIEQSRTPEEDRRFFTQHIIPECDIWLIEDSGGRVAGFLAMKEDYIDRLYVAPDRQRMGFGSALIRHAMTSHPQGLRLHTHQKNEPACRFYEKHGFIAVCFGISPPPESEPDVEYHWRGNAVQMRRELAD